MTLNSTAVIRRSALFISVVAIGMLISFSAGASLLNAGLGGTFTMNLDREIFALLMEGSSDNPGHFLVAYYDTSASDYTQYADSYFYLGNTSRTEIPALNLARDVTPVSSSNPSGQASNRYVKSTTPNFAVDSDTLIGTGTLGMTGVELYRGLYSGSLIFGDYSLEYSVANREAAWDDLRQIGTPSGWYLQNNISFSVVAYDLANLSVVFSDNDNWQMTGDLLLSPETADFLQNQSLRLADAGDFCLGVGAYAGCGRTVVPLPGAVWLFVSGLGSLGLSAVARRRKQS